MNFEEKKQDPSWPVQLPDDSPVVRVIFLSLPKTAHTSVKASLNFTGIRVLDAPEGEEILNRLISGERKSSIMKEFIPSWKENLKFSFVRNPWDRVFSSWREINCVYDGKDKFEPFLEKLRNGDISNPHSIWHCCKQLYHLKNNNGEIEADFIGRFENLQLDFNILKSFFNLRAGHLSHLNQKTNGEYKEHYNDYTKKIVSQIYEEDIDYFKYSF